MQNLLFEEILTLQRMDALNRIDAHRIEAIDARNALDAGLRGAVAAMFVRIGMTLDHDAVDRVAVAR